MELETPFIDKVLIFPSSIKNPQGRLLYEGDHLIAYGFKGAQAIVSYVSSYKDKERGLPLKFGNIIRLFKSGIVTKLLSYSFVYASEPDVKIEKHDLEENDFKKLHAQQNEEEILPVEIKFLLKKERRWL